MIHTRWSNSMAGEEYARIYSWGNDPKRKVCGERGGHVDATPLRLECVPESVSDSGCF